MKILVCSDGFLPAYGFGGVPYSTFHLSKALVSGGASVKVLTTDRNGRQRLNVATDRWTEYDGIPVWYARTAPGPLLFARSTRRVLREELPAVDCVIDSATLWTDVGLAAWRAERRIGKPSITYVRGLLDPWALAFRPWRKRLAWFLWSKRMLDDASAIVALSEAERRDIANMGVSSRIHVIPNGATLESGGPAPRDLVDATFPGLKGRRYVLFLGRVHDKKGLEILIPAISDLVQTASDVTLVVAGPIDPGYAARFRELSRLLDGRIIVTGTVDGTLKTALLTCAHLFALPSHGEGLPVAVLEALLCGCPVVISAQCNLPEVEQAGAGYVVETNRKQFVDAMRALLDDEPGRREMSARARMLAQSTFDWEIIGARVLSLCEQVTADAQSVAVEKPAPETLRD